MNMFNSLQARAPARRLVSGGALSAGEIAALQDQLAALGGSAVKPLLEALPPGPVNAHAQALLERLLTDKSLPHYLEALRSTKYSIADAAVAALSHGKGYDAEKLVPLLGDPAYLRARIETILTAQAQALSPRTLIQALSNLPREARTAVVGLLEARADASIAFDLVRLGTSEDPKLRALTLRLLARIDHPSVPDTAIRMLDDPQPTVRVEAVRCLAVRHAVSAIPALCGRLRDDNLKVQAAAIETLIEMNDVGAVKALLDYLKDESEYVRRAAVEVLNRVVTTEARAVEPLLSALEDEDWWVRERAIDALAKSADARALEPLVAMIDRDQKAVPAVMRALGAIGGPRAVETVCAHASSETPEVRAAAAEALKLLAKSEPSEAARARVTAALREAGGAARATPPLEMKQKADPETGRSRGALPALELLPASDSRHPAALPPGTLLDERYRIIRALGGGPAGTVYMAEDTLVNEPLALRVLAPDLCRDEVTMQRLVDEVKLARRLTHPNVVRIYECLRLGDRRAISMEFVTGRDLKQLMAEQGRMELTRALGLAEQVLAGLAAAHGIGVFHGDLKPSNLLVGLEEIVKIGDFGLGAVTRPGAAVASPPAPRGAIAFVAPELLEGGIPDARSELYSLGCVLHFALSGAEPASASASGGAKRQAGGENAQIPALAEALDDIPENISEWVAWAMARAPAERPAGAAEWIAAMPERRRAA